MLTDIQDAYGHQILAFLESEGGYEIIERDDGYFDISGGPASYFAPYAEWPVNQKEALTFAQGRALDIGAGAGRVSLHLQEQGFEVLAVDISPLAIEVCRRRGVRLAEVIPVTRLSTKLGLFDTIVMFGNNFGLFGNLHRARRLLKRFHKMTGDHGRILVESNNPYLTENPHHLAYQETNRLYDRLSGQLRIRVRFQKYKTPWFEYLLVSPQEMRSIVAGTGWRVARFFSSPSSLYCALIVKHTASDL